MIKMNQTLQIQKQKPKLILIKIFLNSTGDLCLVSGNCDDNYANCSSPGDNSFIVRNSSSDNMIFLNSTGAMCLIGSLYEGRANATGEYTLEYDDNGNLISGFEKVYTYNDFNQLTSVNNSNGLLEEYVYDDSGNRIKKYNYETNTTTYYIDSSFIQVVNSSGIYNETYYYDSRDLVAKKNNDGEISYYHPDHLGSTSLVTNSTGGIVENTFYMPFGNVISGGDDRFGYTSKEKDTSTGLNYYGARYYDSYTRHFTQADEMITNLYNPQDLNSYVYVRNNPYSNKDESGNLVMYFGGIAMGGSGFGVSTSAGFVFSVSFSKGIQLGTYVRPGVGVMTPTASAGIEFGISPFQESIEEFKGKTYDIGGSVGEIGKLGGGISIPSDKEGMPILSNFIIEGTVSLDPVPASGYATVSQTYVNTLFQTPQINFQSSDQQSNQNDIASQTNANLITILLNILNPFNW